MQKQMKVKKIVEQNNLNHEKEFLQGANIHMEILCPLLVNIT